MTLNNSAIPRLPCETNVCISSRDLSGAITIGRLHNFKTGVNGGSATRDHSVIPKLPAFSRAISGWVGDTIGREKGGGESCP